MSIALLTTTILGEPVGQGRPRAVRMGGFVRVHAAPKSASWEAIAAQQIRAAWLGEREDRPHHNEPVHVRIAAYRSRPKSLRKSDGMGVLWSTSKPDVDNIVKSVCDALVKAGVLRDDVLVVSLAARSFIAAEGQPARVEVEMREAPMLEVVPWPKKTRTRALEV